MITLISHVHNYWTVIVDKVPKLFSSIEDAAGYLNILGVSDDLIDEALIFMITKSLIKVKINTALNSIESGH